VVDLLQDRTILWGLVRTLPERLPLKKWAAVVSQVLTGCEGLIESLPPALESFRGEGMSFEGTPSGRDNVLSVSGGLWKLLYTIQGSKAEAGRPLAVQLLVDAMIRELGAGESACMYREDMHC
jgi:hypothetical protein